MTKMIVTAEHTTLVVDAAKLMAAESIGSVVVTKNDVLVGMVTRSDLISAQLLSDEIYHSLTLEEVMQSPVVSISANADLGQLVGLMNRTGKHHVPVLDEEEIIGLVATSDVIRVLANVKQLAEILSIDD